MTSSSAFRPCCTPAAANATSHCSASARALDSPRSFGHTHHTHYNVACVYAVLQDTDTAMAWLERSADTGFPCWPFFRIDPHLEHLRANPAFTRLVADLESTYAPLKIQRL